MSDALSLYNLIPLKVVYLCKQEECRNEKISHFVLWDYTYARGTHITNALSLLRSFLLG